jgi:PKD repeat protein
MSILTRARRTAILGLLVVASTACAYHAPDAPTAIILPPSTAPASIRLTAASRADYGLDVVATLLTADGHFVADTPVTFAATAGTFSTSPVTTDPNGIARTVLREAGAATVTASAGTLQTSVPVLGGITPTPAPPNQPPPPPPPLPPPPPPVAFLSVASTGTTGTPVTFVVSAPSTISPTWLFAFGDGTTVSTTAFGVSHTYTTAGLYTATVSAPGVTSGRAVLTITDAPPPPPPPPPVVPALTLTLSCVAAPHLSQTSCNITARDEKGTIVTAGVTSASWDFGDGNTATTHPLAQNTYTQAGSYVIQVSAVGPGGRTGSASTTVTIL